MRADARSEKGRVPPVVERHHLMSHVPCMVHMPRVQFLTVEEAVEMMINGMDPANSEDRVVRGLTNYGDS